LRHRRQTSSISSFDESLGVNTGEEEVYWRIKEKVKKKRRRPKPVARESSTESEPEPTAAESKNLTVQVSEKIHSPIPESLSKTEAENDEAADIEDNVSVCKLVPML
jgi:hypothetical protein